MIDKTRSQDLSRSMVGTPENRNAALYVWGGADCQPAWKQNRQKHGWRIVPERRAGGVVVWWEMVLGEMGDS